MGLCYDDDALHDPNSVYFIVGGRVEGFPAGTLPPLGSTPATRDDMIAQILEDCEAVQAVIDQNAQDVIDWRVLLISAGFCFPNVAEKRAYEQLFELPEGSLDGLIGTCPPPGSLECDDCSPSGGGAGWQHEFALKQGNISKSWTRTRAGSEGLSKVPHVMPYDGVLKVVTAVSSTDQTGPTEGWEWRLIRESDSQIVAAHDVTGPIGVTNWNVPVVQGEAFRLDVRRKGDDDEVNDALVTLYFDKV